ncbi:acetate--CoA ligase family protein [Desulfocurvibacter africanus]|uniref:CoA-binding domain protein n=1 Tax=Desulfocurvibacter africanus subsp. africanus str. Walvis Bay TaxID=690850 RepID=F3YUW8_DESAF|nr:acetate--CoA ligase [Desulfocurvibacter africanus]EGJ49145.1 CoA-binding domain protein [Desulfocurvibacter africanus subsp. africanus str. Walvis Bay]
MDLQALFSPQSVAVIGASATPGKIGHTVLKNMIDAGFPGRLIPVNPKGGEIEGLPAVTSVAELPRGLDLGVICIPRQFVLDSLRELAAIGARAAIVITAGFKEVGRSGYHLEQEMAGIAREHGMALLGPNCLGLIDTAARVNATFATGKPQPGSIAFFSQSGALCVAILDWAAGAGVGFSSFVSLGNKAVLDEADMLQWLGRDDKTRVILGYLENVQDGQTFLARATEVTRNKPVIMLKSGTTAAGARAASSHTGAIAGSDQAYGAAFHKAGIIRAERVSELFDLARAFATQPLPKGPNLAVVTNAGGPGILAADAAERSRLIMASLSPSTLDKLKAFLPAYASLYNPIDIIGDADAERFRKTLAAVAADEHVHSLLVVLAPTATADVEAIAKAVTRIARESGKPVFGCFMGSQGVVAGHSILMEAGVPVYQFPEPAIASIEALARYAEWRASPEPEWVEITRDLNEARRIIEEARRWGVREIVEFQAQELLRAYNLPTPQTRLARSSEEAATAAGEIGYPVVLKIASAQISHKSDVGGVAVGLKNLKEVLHAFTDITSRAQRMRPEAYIMGCLVQAMAPKGSREVIVGFKRDDQFGPLVMFGLGGIYVEVLKDISFRLAPLSLADARDMIREVRSYMLLKGFRGEPAVNFQALERIILTMSALAMDFPEIYEAEFNPVLAGEQGAIVADVRLSLSS